MVLMVGCVARRRNAGVGGLIGTKDCHESTVSSFTWLMMVNPFKLFNKGLSFKWLHPIKFLNLMPRRKGNTGLHILMPGLRIHLLPRRHIW